MNQIDRAIGITEKATRSDNDWLRLLAQRNLLELVGNRAKAMREGKGPRISPEPPVESDWAERREVKRILNAAAVVFSLIFIGYVVPTALGFVNEQESKVVGLGR